MEKIMEFLKEAKPCFCLLYTSYESLWCLALFIFLIWLDRRRSFPGQIGCLYGMLYSLERGLVEQLRTDSLMIGPFKQAQVLSFCVFLFCLAAYMILMKKEKKS